MVEDQFHAQILDPVKFAQIFLGAPTTAAQQRLRLILVDLLAGVAAGFVAVFLLGRRERVDLAKDLLERLDAFMSEAFRLEVMPVFCLNEIERMGDRPVAFHRYHLAVSSAKSLALLHRVAHSGIGFEHESFEERSHEGMRKEVWDFRCSEARRRAHMAISSDPFRARLYQPFEVLLPFE